MDNFLLKQLNMAANQGQPLNVSTVLDKNPFVFPHTTPLDDENTVYIPTMCLLPYRKDSPPQYKNNSDQSLSENNSAFPPDSPQPSGRNWSNFNSSTCLQNTVSTTEGAEGGSVTAEKNSELVDGLWPVPKFPWYGTENSKQAELHSPSLKKMTPPVERVAAESTSYPFFEGSAEEASVLGSPSSFSDSLNWCDSPFDFPASRSSPYPPKEMTSGFETPQSNHYSTKSPNFNNKVVGKQRCNSVYDAWQNCNTGDYAKNCGSLPPNLPGPSMGMLANYPPLIVCSFCYTNKAPICLFASHELRNEMGITTCPILRKHICPQCGISGDFAHTLKQCPMNNVASPPIDLNNINQLQKMVVSGAPLLFWGAEAPRSYNDFFRVFNTHLNSNLPQHQHDDNVHDLNREFGRHQLLTFPKRYHKEKKEYCKFCRKNNEEPRIYNSHILKNADGTIVCPILRNFTCNICGATGDHAHTRKYCPQNNYDSFIQHVSRYQAT